MDKVAFRKKYKELRAQLSPDEVEELSLQIANKSLELPIWDATNYHIFLSIIGKKEVNTEYLLHILQGKDKSVVLSKSDFKTGELRHILLQENTAIHISEFGIPEPVTGIEIAPQQLDVVFVPLLAFDTHGNRIGYGKGFYDRFLEQCRPETLVVGLSFFEPEISISVENTDIPLHFCVTPKKIYSFKKT
ncbi:5-formyltetrahydrofolate cyclo-ligase [Ulvibacter sp. MAR_2010_11]|uniref:5-formyltetrahydrofolate cyclo-ligase n=1 Tax=Ulvibacter sp. MAR_2010_11 TaxID=1250229 RepID=UPI000C2C7A72|nr:5-formyltetrahydrofolate cyclo-ligase [Ulvibacter sp. MAR_2010_11]PKA82804.1 5-formyltetrahydrofolate cyclo-ligase [Ulvibacter sp. MAR_2010_11]